MTKTYELEDNTIIIHRDLNELDIFVRDFLAVLTNHTNYLIVSGYVSITSGRSRATEVVDLLLPRLDEEKFTVLFNDLTHNGFWCYQGDDAVTAHEYIKNYNSIRFARKNTMFPNVECIPIDKSRTLKFFEFNNPQKMKVQDFEFFIPPL